MSKKPDRRDEQPPQRGGYELKPEYAALAVGEPMGRLLARRRTRKARVTGACDWDVNTDPTSRGSR